MESSTTCRAHRRRGRAVGVGRRPRAVGGRELVADQAARRRPAPVTTWRMKVSCSRSTSQRPASSARHRPDLGGDELHPVVVELLAEPKPDAVTLVEAGRDDPAAARPTVRIASCSARSAASLDGGIGAAAAGRLAQQAAGRRRRLGGVEDGVGAELQRDLERGCSTCPRRTDAGAAQGGQPGREQADDPWPKIATWFAELDVGGEDGVERDRADPGEDALPSDRPPAGSCARRPSRPAPLPRCGDPRSPRPRRRPPGPLTPEATSVTTPTSE